MDTLGYSHSDLMNVAETLLDSPSEVPSEYARGICELIGRLLLDVHGIGEGTGENALNVANTLNVRLK